MMNLNDWCFLIYDFGFEKVISHLHPLSILYSICWFVQKLEMLVYWLRLGAVQAEQNLWFSIRMKWSWSTFWWVKIMRGWPGQSVRWRCWGEEGREVREGNGECAKGSGRKKRTQGDRWATHWPWCKEWRNQSKHSFFSPKDFNASLRRKCFCVHKSQIG